MSDYKEGTKPSLKAVNDIVQAARASGNAALLDTIAWALSGQRVP